MANTSATGKYYTLRNDIRLDLLQGEKINGLWHFTPEQVEAFMRHPAVCPGIKTHQNNLLTISCWTPPNPPLKPA